GPSRTARAVRASRRHHRLVEPLVHAVVVLAAALLALLVGECLPGAVLVPRRAIGPDRERAQAELPDGGRHRDIEVAVEAVALVEAADREQDVAAGGLAVPLYRVALAGGHLVEVLEVEGPQTPRGHDARAVAERLLEHREERSGDLDGRIELEHRSPACDAQEGAPTRALTEVAVRVVDQHARLARGELVETALRGFARSLIEDEHLAVGRDETKDAA